MAAIEPEGLPGVELAPLPGPAVRRAALSDEAWCRRTARIC